MSDDRDAFDGGFHSSRHTVNPIEWLTERGVDCSHITYDPTLRDWDYRIIRQQTHDGTMLFTYQMEQEILARLAHRSTYHKPAGEPTDWRRVRYTVGPLRIAALYGIVDLPAGRFPGQRERFTLPVKYTYLDG